MSLRFPNLRGGAPLLAALVLSSSAWSQGASPATGALLTGTIDLLEIDNPNDVWSSGRMVVSGQVVILPRNLLIDLPANRLTLKQLFDDAPPAALAEGKTGLATMDGAVGSKAVATILGNRTAFGNVIAGDVFIEKGPEAVNGMVTFINHTAGYLRIDGIVGDDATGEIVRINDPESRHTIQSGAGCAGGPNCSADVRFGLDPDNYTVVYTTGYPAGIPSTVPAGQRPGFRAGDNAAAASNAAGVGDPFCPSTNRGVNPVPNSTLFAPIRVGDTISAEGNFETIGGVRFLSAHSLNVLAALTTANNPTQPDYIIWAEVEWDVPSFANERQRMLLIGFSTLPNSQVDVFALHVNRNTNANNEFPIASTVGNPDTINQGIGATAGGIFKIRYDLDFLAGVGDSPCENLRNAGFNVCPGGGTLAENFAITNPISRELIGRTRRSPALNPGVITRDINGNQAPNGEYLTPVGLGHPEFGEIDLNALQTPFNFDGLPWNLDRRLAPGGCDGNCENTVQQLSPFPWSGTDPAVRAPIRNEVFAFFPFGANNVLAWPPTAPAAIPILPTPIPPNVGPAPAPTADFTASNAAGTLPLTVSFTDASIGIVNARLWDFGDGTFSIAQNPVHTYTQSGSFAVTLVALGTGGTDSETKLGAVTVNPGGGPGAPVAGFNQDRTAGNVPLTVNFTDTSTGDVNAWQWNFGDGSTSALQNPSHIYTTGGLFTVSLTATGPGGTNTLTKLNLINANVPGDYDVDFVTNVTTGTAPLQVRFRAVNVSGTGISGTFDFGDGTTGTVTAGNGRINHTYTAPGVYTVTLTATDGFDIDVEQKVNFITVTAPFTADEAPAHKR